MSNEPSEDLGPRPPDSPPAVPDGLGGSAGAELAAPSAERMLEGVLTLGREVHLEMDEHALIELFLTTLSELFPRRVLAVRVLDPRSAETPRAYVANGTLRGDIEHERITVKQSSVEKTRLKSAVASSARIKLRDTWDSPFPGVAAGFGVPLVASGEFYGQLDVGYPLGLDRAELDEPLMLPIANHLSVALRNERLHRDTTVLRDYQAKLIEHANALILGVDLHWRIMVCNQALCKLTGFERDEVIGNDLRDWLPVSERPRLQKLFLQALTGGTSGTVEVNLVTRTSGNVRTVWSVAAISGGSRVEAVVAIGQDQTQLRELQGQVIQAEKLATLGQLAAGVVHELNNPLTSITVYAEYLLRKALAAKDMPAAPEPGDIEKLRRISAGAHRILEFAKDLVQYAKPAGDELDVIAINNVVRHSLSFCEHLFEQEHIELVQDLSSELPALYAVPGQLEQVLINLGTNAAHAVDGVGTVTVRTFSPEAGVVGLSIADTGPGIPEADRERVFEPFFTTKTDGKGTGLGLSIVRNIIEQHEGQVVISSSDSGGALFTITLPGSQ